MFTVTSSWTTGFRFHYCRPSRAVLTMNHSSSDGMSRWRCTGRSSWGAAGCGTASRLIGPGDRTFQEAESGRVVGHASGAAGATAAGHRQYCSSHRRYCLGLREVCLSASAVKQDGSGQGAGEGGGEEAAGRGVAGGGTGDEAVHAAAGQPRAQAGTGPAPRAAGLSRFSAQKRG